jgi:hypothetical protein
VGKPNERERERERERLFSFKKVQNSSTISHFQPRKIPHSTKIVPQKSASKSVPNLYYCTASFIPRFPCPWSTIQNVPYGPETDNRTLKITPKNASISVPNLYDYGSVQYDLPQQKNNLAQNPKRILEICAFLPWKTCPLCCSLSSLKLTQKISLTQLLSSSRCVLPTIQCILL